MICSDLASKNDMLSTSKHIISIADRRHLWRRSLTVALEAGWPEALVTTLGVHAVEPLNREPVPSAVILAGGESLAKNVELRTDFDRINKALSDTPILLLTDDFDAADITEAMSMGAKGYLTSSASIELLVQVLRVLIVGGMAFPAVSGSGAAPALQLSPNAKSGTAQGLSIDLFTPRELQVLAALGEGKPNKIIAYEFSICETTVKVHVSHIMRKLGATNRTHVALLASEIAEELRQAVRMQASNQAAMATGL